MKTTTLVLPVLLATMSYTIGINAAPHHKSGIILSYDLNGDDKLSMEEFVSARRARFDKTDTNENRLVNVDEYVYEYEGRLQTQLDEARESHVSQTKTRFNAVNKDEDGFISKDEFIASGKRGFDYLDADKNGVILASDPNPERKKAKSESKDKPLRRRFSIGMPSSHSVKGMQELYDVNGDESVSYEEFLSVRSEQFKRADENSDELMDLSEYTAEFEDRLDAQIAESHEGQIKQTYVRFCVLDKDDNKEMTFKEFMHSGIRSFNRWDTDGDGWVTLEDPAPTSWKEQKEKDKASGKYKEKEKAKGKDTAKDCSARNK